MGKQKDQTQKPLVLEVVIDYAYIFDMIYIREPSSRAPCHRVNCNELCITNLERINLVILPEFFLYELSFFLASETLCLVPYYSQLLHSCRMF